MPEGNAGKQALSGIVRCKARWPHRKVWFTKLAMDNTLPLHRSAHGAGWQAIGVQELGLQELGLIDTCRIDATLPSNAGNNFHRSRFP
jgi:hypothetical protein